LTDTRVLVAGQLSVCDTDWQWQWHSVSSDTTFTFPQDVLNVLSENKIKYKLKFSREN